MDKGNEGRMSETPVSISFAVLERIVASVDEGLCVIDAAGTVLMVNLAAARMTGLGTKPRLPPIDDAGAAGEFDWSVAREALAARAAITACQTTNSGRTLRTSGRPVFAPDGALQCVVVTVRDVSDMSRLVTRFQDTVTMSESYRAQLQKLILRESDDSAIVARSRRMQEVKGRALQYAGVESPILLTGEAGTGKRLIARLIHRASGRAAGPFIELNCPTVPPELIQLQLFGSARGRERERAGLAELADAGTLLIRCVEALPQPVQRKLLRLLEDGVMWPVGAISSRRVDVRVIATSRDLEAAVTHGGFRRDLYYRLKVLPIGVPPLRDRRDDIPWLVDRTLQDMERRLARRSWVTADAMARLMAYSFPGNTRELELLLERLLVSSPTGIIDVDDLPKDIRESAEPDLSRDAAPETLREALGRVEARLLKQALQRYGTQVEWRGTSASHTYQGRSGRDDSTTAVRRPPGTRPPARPKSLGAVKRDLPVKRRAEGRR